MIRSFKHKGLKRLFERGDRSGVRPDMVEMVEDILGRLNESRAPQDMSLPGYRLHPLKGNLKGFGPLRCGQTGALFFALKPKMLLMLN